ncbi:Clp protease N-terminal domain-containing protein [Micromonospora krabiensis]|uniref:Clp amino terminal domain-containing protein, pathogenicity island component n=1 Tax=Micromonospora krabiensis TaxID=307121 RepID=A0A1C3MY89_9ACTN|nr:Clp protease N-terminal domain-containing protein [Micromonospora krabiensis]SBV25264.1 Clp amino terminal domain-containing protein, pathogenicity island component [Micromonospora krabiensis]
MRSGQPPFVALGARPMRVLRDAYAAALRREAASVGTLDVLCQVALRRGAVPPWLIAGASGADLTRMGVSPRRIPAARSVGELVPGPAGVFDPEARAVLREVEWQVHRRASRKGPTAGTRDRPTWTPGVHTTVTGALRVAHDAGVPFANLSHLVLGMLHQPACDGTRHRYPHEYARQDAVDRLRGEPDLRRSDEPHPDLDPETLILQRGSGPLADRVAGRVYARMSRLSRLGPLFTSVEREARRQAVRFDHQVIGPAHVLLAMLTHDAALDAAGIRVPADHYGRNRAAHLLRARGVEAEPLRLVVASLDGADEPPADVLAGQLRDLRPGDPYVGAEVAVAMTRAMDVSLAHRHADTGTSHLLAALLEDGAGGAATVLRRLGVDPGTVAGAVEQELRAAPATW